ncbi:MAG: hydrogenase maturation nickel metallochaperone HypA [Chloroflexi bacterium]|nr:hydrogenase maturation nickel metallochaperone HypA [Chloroflexota bacterium]
MHELSVTQSILEIALRHAEKAGAQKITDLYLVVGELSSIIDSSVQFYWNIISQGTAAENATLHFRRIAAEMECKVCGNRFKIRQQGFICPYCNSLDVCVRFGDEFYLDAIEVETRKGEAVCV